MKKRLLSLLIAVLMVLQLCTTVIFAAPGSISETVYVQVDALSAGDTYIIVSGNYAMTASGGVTSTGFAVADKYLIAEDGCTAALWTCTGTGTNKTFKNENGAYLGRNSDRLNISVSAENTGWRLNNNQLRNGTSSYYLRVTSSGFTLTTNSSNRATVKFYKKVTVTLAAEDVTTAYTGNVVLPKVSGDTAGLTVKYCMKDSAAGADWKTEKEAVTGFPKAITGGQTVYVALFVGNRKVGDAVSATVKITKVKLDMPAPKMYAYDGKEKTLAVDGFVVSGVTKGTDKGEYSALLSLADTTSTEWSASAKARLDNDGKLSYHWYIVEPSEAQNVELSVYTLNNLDNMTGSKEMDCVVTAHQTAPQTDATLWIFAPTAANGNTGYIFTKLADGDYRYLGVSGSKLTVIKGTTEKVGVRVSGHVDPPTGTATFTLAVNNESTGEVTLKSGNCYVTLNGGSASSTYIYLRNISGTPYKGSGYQYVEPMRNNEQKAFYFTNSANPTKALKLTDKDTFTTVDFNAADLAVNYYGMPADPDEIALPMTEVKGTVIHIANAAVWKFNGTKDNFTLSRSDNTNTVSVRSDTGGNGYHDYRLRTDATASAWDFVEASGAAEKDAIKLREGNNGFTFNKHDTNRFGFGDTSNTEVYSSISLYQKFTENVKVDNIVVDYDGTVKLPAVSDADVPEFEFNVKYSVDGGKTWYNTAEALAKDDLFPVEASKTPYTVTVGLFFDVGLIRSVDATVTINDISCDITYDGEATGAKTFTEEKKTSEEKPEMRAGMTVQLDLADGAFAATPTGYTKKSDTLYEAEQKLAPGFTVKDLIPTKAGYVFDGWGEPTVDTTNQIVTLTAKWLEDTKGPNGSDNIPDKYQIVVTFKLVKGIWAVGGNANDRTEYVTLFNADGEWDESGSGKLTAAQIPTEMVADTGYGNGAWDTAPDTTTELSADKTYTYTFTANKNKLKYRQKTTGKDPEPTEEKDIYTDKTVTLNTNGGAFSMADKSALEGEGYAFTGENCTKTVKDDVTVTKAPTKENYIFDGWEYTNDGQGNATLTAKWLEDTKGPNGSDNIPDKYQIVVTFKLVKGIWAVGGNANDRTEYVTLFNADGEWDEAGSGKLTAAQIPTEMVADTGYGNGAWDTTPDTLTALSADSTYTYTFTANKNKLKYRQKTTGKDPEPTEEKDIYTDKTVTLNTSGGAFSGTDKTALEGEGYVFTGENCTKTVKDDVTVTKAPTKENYIFDGWEYTNDGQGNATLTAKWLEDTKGPNGSDNIPDKYQIVVTFKLVKGTWTAGGNANDRTEYVTLFNADGEWDEAGSGKLTAAQIPTGMVAEAGYDNGTWNTTPNTTTALSADKTYTFTFKAILNKENHICYITGCPDGKVHPENNITRAETAMIFYRLLTNQKIKITTSFSDVPKKAWYAKAVNTLASYGIICGYTDGTFRPEAYISRAEFTAIAVRFVQAKKHSVPFKDVSPKHWAAGAIGTAVYYGWIAGYPDHTFHPGANITRAEAVTVVNRMLDRAADKKYVTANFAKLRQFPDLQDPKAWYFYDMVEAVNEHDYTRATETSPEVWRSKKKK